MANFLNFATKQLHTKEKAQKLVDGKQCFSFPNFLVILVNVIQQLESEVLTRFSVWVPCPRPSFS